MARVLLVDDEVKLGKLVAEALELDGHRITHATGGRQALVELASHPFDVVLTDLRMPEVDGQQVLTQARALTAPPEVIMMTADGSAESAVAAMKAGAADYLTKPFSLDEARIRVRRLANQRLNESKSAQLVQTITPSLVAASAKMKEVLDLASRVAASDATVLILGESGTGKSQLARHIHYSSPRAGGPLLEAHCAAMPESLLESELFGYVRGAFTGAENDREGHLARADGGTLFLDEIGEVSLAIQVKLLRFLQEREFVPVGSTKVHKVDVRVIAATNRDLTAAVSEGQFREDFYYRLNVVTFALPSLRDRHEDILPLVDRFLSSRGIPMEKLTPQTRERLAAHPWPGNVRELENAIERAVILSAGNPITPELLGLRESNENPSATRAADLLTEGFNLDALERDLIYAALERAGGNKAAAARLLGITRRRLYSRLDSIATKAADTEIEGT
ncbi:MAG: sigma-54-dependent transcriptional regulator [Myxococcaceae bacterium]